MALNARVLAACCARYKQQSGGLLPVFDSHSGQTGNGFIGNLLGKVASIALPLATRALPIVGNLARTFLGGMNQGNSWQSSGRRALAQGGRDVLQAGQEALSTYQTRPRSQSKRRPTKRRKTSKRGNF